MNVNIALLTVTDTRTFDNDKSGAILVKKIKEANHNLVERKICKDNKEDIVLILKDWINKKEIDVVITTGGMLAGLCELYDDCHLISSIGGQPPRTAFGHLFSRQLALIEHLGLLPEQSPDEREAMLVRLEYACQSTDFRKSSGAPLLDLAIAMKDHPIALLGPTELQPALIRFKNQLNENAGRFARIGGHRPSFRHEGHR